MLSSYSLEKNEMNFIFIVSLVRIQALSFNCNYALNLLLSTSQQMKIYSLLIDNSNLI